MRDESSGRGRVQGGQSSGVSGGPAAGGARSCGDCRACCTVFDLPEYGKPRNVLCPNADSAGPGTGCGVYRGRPDRCRSFECAWKQGLAGEGDRPDRLGVMLYLIPLTDGQAGLGVIELEPEAFDRPRVRGLLDAFEERKPGRILARRAADDSFAPVSVMIEGKPAAGVVSRPGTAGAVGSRG